MLTPTPDCWIAHADLILPMILNAALHHGDYDPGSHRGSHPDVSFSSFEGLLFAGDVRIPVGKVALRVVLPRPHMQLPERRQAVAVRRTDQIHQVSLQRRRGPVRE